MSNQIFILILALGALQGIILGSVLLKKDVPNPKANRFLAYLLFFLSYRLVVEIMRILEWVGVNHWTYHVLLEYNWIYGPLLYFYIASYTYPEFRLTRKDLIHFIPLGVEFIFSNWVKTQNFYWDGDPQNLPWLGAESYILWVHTPFPFVIAGGLILFYTFLSDRWITQLTQTESTRLEIKKSGFLWIQRILWGYRLFAMISIITVSADYLFYNYAFEPFYPIPIYISMALMTYWLGLEGFSRRKEVPYIKKRQMVLSLTADSVKDILDKMKLLMEEGFYKREDASLRSFAEAIGYKSYIVSQMLNEQLNMKFADYLNSYRVKEVKRLMRNPKYHSYTLTAIALEAGFQSKASFNRSFKKFTQFSPSEYRDTLTQCKN